MIVDEMDLVSQLKDAEPLRPEAFERARTVLREAMVDPRPTAAPIPGTASPRARRRWGTVATRGRVGLGIAAVAAVAAMVAGVLAATSPSHPAANPSQLPARSASASPVLNSRLMTVAAVIKAKDGSLPGNASLVISTQTNGSNPPEVGYNLYTDNGDYYWAMTENGLSEAIADHENLAHGVDAREVAAALYAVNGDLATARVRMVNATPNPFGLGRGASAKGAVPGKGQTAAQAAAKPRPVRISATPTGAKPPTGQALQEDLDNYVWNNCIDALTEGAGNAQVRAGVLRLLATVPEVTVKNSTTRGQPTLTLTAGTALFDGITQQVLTISASTGIPISSVSNVPGQKPSSVVTYRVSRVTLANIAAGKF